MKMIQNAFLGLIFLMLASCASVDSNPAAGTWNITINSPMGAMDAVLTIATDGTGNMSSDMIGDAAINDITIDGEKLTFSLTVNAMGQTIPLAFTGTVTGNSLQGEFDSSFGAIPVTGALQLASL